MTENDLTFLPLRVTRVGIGRKRSFDPADKQRLVACLRHIYSCSTKDVLRRLDCGGSAIALGWASRTRRLPATSNGRLLYVGPGARGAVLGQDWVDKKQVS